MNGAEGIILRAVNIHKRFGGTHALKGVEFTLSRGEVHALLGENGAGKSTFIKALSGAHPPDEGLITIDGEEFRRLDPYHAKACGISTIYQESSLFPSLSVVENIFAGNHIHGRFGVLRWKEMKRKAHEVFERLGVEIPLLTQLGALDKSTAQIVEIAKALVQDAQIIIMDEPTAALTSREVDRFFEIIATLRQAGKAVIYISHYIDEVLRISDRITIFRDGRIVGSELKSKVGRQWIIEKMTGQVLGDLYGRRHREAGPVILRIYGLSVKNAMNEVSFSVRKGEIVGIAGLYGSGRSEILSAAFGITKRKSGAIQIDGRSCSGRPWDLRDAGIGLIPGDRTRKGTFLGLSAGRNLVIAALKKVSVLGFLDDKKIAQNALMLMTKMSVMPRDPDLVASGFSGGNQQKLVIGRWLASSPRVLFMDEPTQGVDVGAKAEIYRFIDSLVNDGLGIVLASSDNDELAEIADRILVMYGGKLIGQLPRGSTTKDILNAMNGFANLEKIDA
jgi:ABC-type sugar transport system ATPase subunit